MEKPDFRTTALPVWARQDGESVILSLRVQPGAKRTAAAGPYGDRLKIALHAPPVDGKANAELLRFLGDALGLRARQLALAAGAASRDKQVRISGLDDADALAALALRLAALDTHPGWIAAALRASR